MIEFFVFVVRFFVQALGGWQLAFGRFFLVLSLLMAVMLSTNSQAIPIHPEELPIFASMQCLIIACLLLSGKRMPRRHFWQPPQIPDPPLVVRDPHGATTLHQILMAKFQKSRPA